MTDPLVMTLALDPDAQRRLDELRARWFPRARNHLAAHVTLFHALPGDELDAVREAVAEVAGAAAPMAMAVHTVRPLRHGVALDMASSALGSVHADLAGRFGPWLTRQDRQSLHPHVTVQNKVSEQEAAALAADLGGSFEPWTAIGTGLELWWYRGGPWEHVATVAFGGGGTGDDTEGNGGAGDGREGED